MNIKEQHIVSGMVTDMNVSRFDATKVQYARNIRITQMEGNKGLLCVTNEKGTKTCTTSATIVGTIVGSCILNDYLVVFTYDSTYVIPEYADPFPTIEGPEHIYRLEKGTTYDFNVTELYKGNLDFVKDGTPLALETLSVYETEDIQKVYWVDGVHQLRCINITKTYESPVRNLATIHTDSKFDSNPSMPLIESLTVTKLNTGGEFPAGTIQYAFTYFNLNGPETNIFRTSSLYELSPQEKGVAADGRTTCSFKIHLERLDEAFNCVRVYAIVRTSANATPSVRIVGDYTYTKTGTNSRQIDVIDNGMIGSTVDATYLLFVGGEPICPATIAIKDNTLFLGNISLTRPSLADVECNGSTVGEIIEEMRLAGKLPFLNKGALTTPTGSGDWFYDYNIDNNRSSIGLRRFKRGETYRLGIIAQHETGIWSDVLWIGDYKNNITPEFYKHKQKAGQFWLYMKLYGQDDTDLHDVFTALEDAGFRRLAPVAVYPEGVDRDIFCQGLVSATVYNVEDRFINRPFSQASWFFRPISEGFGVAAFPHCSLYSTTDTNLKGYAEIQLNNNPRNFLPQVKGYWGSSGTSARIPATDMIAMFGNDYYVDTSIVTLNSPDIELDDSLQQEDLNGLKFRIVGVAKSGTQNIVAHTYSDFTAGILPESKPLDMEMSRLAYLDTTPEVYVMANYPSFPGYLGNIHQDNVFSLTDTIDINVPFILYPWNKTGSVFGKAPDDASDDDRKLYESSMLNSKVMSSFWFAHTELFDDPTDIDTDVVKLFDDTQGDFIPLGETADSSVYYGNIDSVRTYKKDSLCSTNRPHASDNFNMMEPRFTGSHVASFSQTTRAPHITSKYYLVQSPSYSGGTIDIAGLRKYSLEEMLLKYGYLRTEYVGSTQEIYFTDDAPVPIRYKSTKHAVISLAHTQYEIPSLYRCESLFTAYNGSAGATTTVYPFWDEENAYTMSEGKVPFATEWEDSFLYHDAWEPPKDSYKEYSSEIPTLYIGELYRETTQERTEAKFGGTSKEALSKNIWTVCGSSVSIEDLLENGIQPNPNDVESTGVTIGGQVFDVPTHSPTAFLRFSEGDTYLTRYDCLKTYPYAEKDINSVVEVFSTDLETRVNLDARYDNARGLIDNTLVRPENINLVNRLGYEQKNNFFTYTALDPNRETADKFPNLVAITREKTLGEEVDVWMSNNLLSTQDLEGTYGEIEALRTYNNDVYAFQTNAFGQILFNNRVQIPTGDGQPIEITNGMKLQGIRYLSNKIGCSNKWSIALSNSRMYWYDAGTKDIWAFGGQLENLSTSLGVKGWLSDVNPARWTISDMTPIRTLHDEKYNDLYFIIGNSTKENYGALVYSETLNTFVSVMDYTELEEMHNLHDRVFAVKKDGIHAMWEGNYNSFFGTQKPYILRFIANAQPTMHKVFDTVQWRSDSWNSAGKYIPNATFTRMQVWNQYQKSKVDTTTGDGILTNTPGKPSPLKKKFNTFRALVPRDKIGNSLTDSDYRYKQFSRIRGNYAVIELTHSPVDSNDTYKMQFYDLEVGEFL